MKTLQENSTFKTRTAPFLCIASKVNFTTLRGRKRVTGFMMSWLCNCIVNSVLKWLHPSQNSWRRFSLKKNMLSAYSLFIDTFKTHLQLFLCVWKQNGSVNRIQNIMIWEKILSISCYNLRSMAVGGLLQIVFGKLMPSKNSDLLLGTKDSGKDELCPLTYTLSQDTGSDEGS